MLLDTCLLSELVKPRPEPSVVRWFDALPEDAPVVSALTLGEIAKGVERLPAGAKRKRIEAWLATLREQFGDRILPVTGEIAETWGRISARRERRGRPLPVIDGLIAATALVHGVPLVTRNVQDFEGTGVKLISPWG